MEDRIPDQALSKRQATEAVCRRPHIRTIADAATCSVKQIYDGKKVNTTFLTRNVSRTTELSPASTKPSVVSVEEIDQGISGDPLTEYADPNGNIKTPKRVQSYSGVTDIQQTECPNCSGSGRTCTNCSGSGTLSCNRCSAKGEIIHGCGCRGKEKNSGYGVNNIAVAETGEILRVCKTCGGDGGVKRVTKQGTGRCEKCYAKGAFVETCQNCGGSGIAGREQCMRCDGRGEYTCEECDGAGNVDVCSMCEGEGDVNEQEVTKIWYELTHEEQLVDADVPVEGHKDEIVWIQTGTEIITNGFRELPVSADGEGTAETIAAKVKYCEPVLYRAEIKVSHNTLNGGSETASVLVSDEIIKTDGRFSASSKGGVFERISAISRKLVASALWAVFVGLVASFPLGFGLALLVDGGVISNPAAPVRHLLLRWWILGTETFEQVVLMAYVATGGSFLILSLNAVRKAISRYEFSFKKYDSSSEF